MKLALRTLIVMGVAGLIIAAVYFPVRWSGGYEKAKSFEDARQRVEQKLPLEYRERRERERRDLERRLPPLVGVRIMANQFLAVAVIAFLGRTVLRLRLKR